jgi:hypothetical protein
MKRRLRSAAALVVGVSAISAALGGSAQERRAQPRAAIGDLI